MTDRGAVYFFSSPSGVAHEDRPNLAEGVAVCSGVYLTSPDRSTSSM
jgi:hypothetical protein